MEEERAQKWLSERGKKAKVDTRCFISTPADRKCDCALPRDDRLLAEMEKRWLLLIRAPCKKPSDPLLSRKLDFALLNWRLNAEQEKSSADVKNDAAVV